MPAFRAARLTALALLTLLGLALVGCGDDATEPPVASPTPSPTAAPTRTPTTPSTPAATPTPSPTPPDTPAPTTPTPTPAPGTITSASLVRDILLDLSVRVAWDSSQPDGGFIKVAQARYPGIRFVPASQAEANAISYYFGAADAKSPVSVTNPLVFAFAVLDATGVCAAGDISGAPTPRQAEKVAMPAGAACSGQAAFAEVARRLR